MGATAVAVVALALLLATVAPVAAHAPIETQIADLTRRIAAAPANATRATLHLRRGELQRILGRPAAAGADYETARRLDPDLAAVDLGLGLLRLETGRPAAAIAALDLFLARRPGDPEGLAARARACARLGRYLEAAGDFTAAIAGSGARRPPAPDLYIERARALASAGDVWLDDALAGLEDGLDRLGRPVSLALLATDIERRLGRPAARTGPLVGARRGATIAIADPRDGAPVPAPGAGTQSLVALARGPYLQVGTSEGIVVRWRTDRGADGVVRYGTAPDDLRDEARDPRSIRNHAIALDGLAPETRYYYTVGSSTQVLAGGAVALSFMTAPLPGARRPTRVWALGDSGTADLNARRVRDAYRAFSAGRATDVWLMLGDNAYPDGTDAQYQAAVFDIFPDLLARTALWPVLGNHDGHTADSETQSGPYYDIFTLPAAGEAGGLPSGTEAYYSFDHANIHLIALDSYETDRSADGAMMTWLRADALSTRQDWTIAFWHHPPYSKGSHDSDREVELIQMREVALPILEAAGVDLVLTGHSHSYERSFLLDGHYGRSSTLTPAMKKDPGDGRPGGSGGSGAYEKPTAGPARHEGAVYVVAGSSGQTGGGSLDHPAMFLSLDALGSLVLDVDGLRLEATFLDAGGAARDRFTIEKRPQNRPPLAVARAPRQVECDTHAGGMAVLDGTGSSDPDGDAGGGIVLYEWFEAYGTPAERPLGTGPLRDVTLAVGAHDITLRVTDPQGAVATDTVVVSVADTTAPTLAIAPDPGILRPPDHTLRTVRFAYQVDDACDPSPVATLAGVASSEPDDAPGAGDGATIGDVRGGVLDGDPREGGAPGSGAGKVDLRAERAGAGPGRVYTVIIAATDSAGITATAAATVVVPHDRAARTRR